MLRQLSGTPWIMGTLLYGAGLRLMECLRLRVKDVDFSYHQIVVRDGKGHKDRVTMLPQNVQAPLQRHLHAVKTLHTQDLQADAGHVYLPYALERKYPNANRDWAWQYVFPAARLSRDPRTSTSGGIMSTNWSCSGQCRPLSARPILPRWPVAIRFATRLRPICSKRDTTSARCRNSSGTKM